jgi:magnesium and cobalt transporter
MDEQQDSSGAQRSWLERLGQALLGEPKDQDALLELLRDAQQRDLLDAEALGMMEGVMQVSEMQVRDVMIPRAQMVALEHDWPLDKILEVVIDSGHSRLPVVGENRDEVLGVLLAKDMLRYFAAGGDAPLQLTDFLRPAKFIPESKRLNALLKEFRLSRLHMAIVLDEYGGVAGLVTIEDVLEQIVGEIDDEHDAEEDAYIREQPDGHHLVLALTPIEDFNAYFGSTFSDDEFDTIGGLVMNTIGRLPRHGETVDVSGFEFSVMRADNRRIHLLGLNRRPDAGISEPD